ncbi:MAG: hypothetical protein AAGA30_17300, partial [Planctomycetota bacterium]
MSCRNFLKLFLLFSYLAAAVGSVEGQSTSSANSTRKFRTRANSIAAQAGMTVQWRRNLEQAMDESLRKSKPVFWYVPTVEGTFMDRKIEIDRYMMAGFFSWPHLADGINQNFIPLKSAPTREQQEKYQLKPYAFVEPGFLILSPEGKLQLSVDQITTQNVAWLDGILNSISPGKSVNRDKFDKCLSQFNDKNQKLVQPRWQGDVDRFAFESTFYAMDRFQAGNHGQAKMIWKELSERLPNHPLG